MLLLPAEAELKMVGGGGQTGGGAKQLYKPGNADGERDGAQVNRWQSERESQCRERERAGENAVTSLQKKKEKRKFLPSSFCCGVVYLV